MDLNGSLGRVDGGFGMALQDPSIELEIETCDKPSPYSSNGIVADIVERAKEIFRYDKGLKVKLIDDYAEHIGLGHETQLVLAIGSAVRSLKGVEMRTSILAHKMGRGGTSGIGVGLFEKGGFVVDAGHSFGPKKAKTSFLPSSYSDASPPPLICRHDIPEDWRVLLVTPFVPSRLYGEYELNVFKEFCPVPEDDVEKISRLVLFGIIPAVIEDDLASFGLALDRINCLGFKKAEIGLQHPFVREIMKSIKENGITAVGLSSMGPTVFAIYPAEKDVFSMISSLNHLESKYSLNCAIVHTKGCNMGATIKTIPDIAI
jgi:beta-ribofuranosylaminobenzene 5'-phosphate synthase